MKPDNPKPHPEAYKITIEQDPGTLEVTVTDDEWVVKEFGQRRHGWFIPVDVPDNISHRRRITGPWDLPKLPETHSTSG